MDACRLKIGDVEESLAKARVDREDLDEFVWQFGHRAAAIERDLHGRHAALAAGTPEVTGFRALDAMRAALVERIADSNRYLESSFERLAELKRSQLRLDDHIDAQNYALRREEGELERLAEMLRRVTEASAGAMA